MTEICTSASNKKDEFKLEPITFSDKNSPKEQIYRDDDIKEDSVDYFSATKS